MRSIGYNFTEAELTDMIIGSDTSGKGALNFPDFLAAIHDLQRDIDDEDIKKNFKVFDRDGDGYIGPAELRHSMTQFGETLTDEEINEMIRQADRDGDGKISFDDFKQMMLAKDS
ncbi:EF-hand [Neolentinus lepideus HHB14362 ss-1]|uniref:EF-hand n=1 Tax=Neolentinus lepideus HHB14362 ss-1 TaxID=1314782 RepID=A0A165SYT4_9AGAM|nr:EF-hand [Neolentinus lepideus HHB14362 ss-1]